MESKQKNEKEPKGLKPTLIKWRLRGWETKEGRLSDHPFSSSLIAFESKATILSWNSNDEESGRNALTGFLMKLMLLPHV